MSLWRKQTLGLESHSSLASHTRVVTELSWLCFWSRQKYHRKWWSELASTWMVASVARQEWPAEQGRCSSNKWRLLGMISLDLGVVIFHNCTGIVNGRQRQYCGYQYCWSRSPVGYTQNQAEVSQAGGLCWWKIGVSKLQRTYNLFTYRGTGIQHRG